MLVALSDIEDGVRMARFKELLRPYWKQKTAIEIFLGPKLFLTGALSLQKKNGQGVFNGRKGYGCQWGLLVDPSGKPLGAVVGNGSQNERTLVSPCLELIPKRLRNKIEVILADGGFYSKPLTTHLRNEYKIELVAPPYKNVKKRFQDGRRLRRLKRRWPVERTIAWLKTHSRLAKRRDLLQTSYLGFLHLACCLILMGRFY